MSKTKTGTIKLSPLSVLHARLCFRYREFDYPVYAGLVAEITSIFGAMPESIQKELVESGFLTDKEEVSK